MKIFKGVRLQRNESLLKILGVVASASSPVWNFKLKKNLGRAYSNVYKNTAFLEEKGFLTSQKQARGRNKKIFAITIKGALASLFAPNLTIECSQLVEQWREKNWGIGYAQSFKNIKDASDLRKLVETIYLHGGSLEEVDEEILKRGLRNPEETVDLITSATLKIEKKIVEDGKYDVKWTYVPGSVSTHLIKKKDNVAFAVMPDEETGKVLFNFLIQDPNFERIMGGYLLTILQTIAIDLMNKGEGGSSSYYFASLRTFVLTATLPDKIASLLSHPEQVLELTKNSYKDIIRLFFEADEFLTGKDPYFIFRATRYDPTRRNLSSLSRDEIKERIPAFLKQMSREG